MNAAAWVSTLLGGASLLGLMVAGVRWLIRRARPLMQMAEDWRGEPERRGPGGVVVAPARMSVMERLAALENGQSAITKELHPNGGGSLRDAVDMLLRDRAQSG